MTYPLGRSLTILLTALAALSLTACGSSSGDGTPTATGRVSGTLQELDAVAARAVQGQQFGGATVTIDAGTAETAVDSQGYFQIHNVADGNHSLYLHLANGGTVEVPIRMLNRRNLELGTVSIANGWVVSHTGFDGYRFGFVDEDGDGINDNFTDADGDGICDKGRPYAGCPYMMGFGFADADGDGINDNFVDADGDGVCDRTGNHFGAGFGFVDEDGDSVNDNFTDADGDGICDHTQTPFSHPFGFVDDDGDGVNDNFTDADGDGVCDNARACAGVPYVATPGWSDADGDQVNDAFCDADGDGINDANGMPYAHGFGWGDANGDQINDRIRDRDGDCVCDGEDCLFYLWQYSYGFAGPHRDQNGDGIDDDTGQPFRHGFGWVDDDGDGANDLFGDANGDGYDDLSGQPYGTGQIPGGSS